MKQFFGNAFLIFALAAASLLAYSVCNAQTCEPKSRCSYATTSCADCLTCSTAPGGYCEYYYQACVNEPECAFYAAACEYMLPANPQGYATCIDAHPMGAAMYSALIDCMVCNQCTGCEPWQWVDPHPGCGE